MGTSLTAIIFCVQVCQNHHSFFLILCDLSLRLTDWISGGTKTSVSTPPGLVLCPGSESILVTWTTLCKINSWNIKPYLLCEFSVAIATQQFPMWAQHVRTIINRQIKYCRILLFFHAINRHGHRSTNIWCTIIPWTAWPNNILCIELNSPQMSDSACDWHQLLFWWPMLSVCLCVRSTQLILHSWMLNAKIFDYEIRRTHFINIQLYCSVFAENVL